MVFGIHFVVFVFRNLSLKFGQNQVSNKGYDVDVLAVVLVVVAVVYDCLYCCCSSGH